MNNGVWHQIENLARKLAVIYDSVHIVCGPVFSTDTTKTIGPNHIRVPDAFFKAFVIRHQDSYHTVAFLCPNTATPCTPTSAMTTVNTIETIVELNLFSFLDDRIEEHVESIVDTCLWIP